MEANLPELPHEYVQIRRRYNHFRDFYKKLIKLVGKEVLPEFPEKNFFGRYKPNVIEERTKKFQVVSNICECKLTRKVIGLHSTRSSVESITAIF